MKTIHPGPSAPFGDYTPRVEDRGTLTWRFWLAGALLAAAGVLVLWL